jgi:putative DNA primase/helicase
MSNTQNMHAALEFLSRLDPAPDARFNIEHFTDVPSGTAKPKPDPLVERYAGLTLRQVEELLPMLLDANTHGAGIFVARNQCDGHRSEKNVTRIRGVHADLDDVSKEELVALMEVLPPSIIVESSPGKWQLYWQLARGESIDKDEAKAINQYLAQEHGADAAAVDVSRLLRLPGFMHMKYRAEQRTPTVTAHYNVHWYTADQIRSAFPMKQPAVKPATVTQRLVNTADVGIQYASQIAAVAAEVAGKYPTLWRGDWANAPRRDRRTGYLSSSEADLALASHIVRACRRLEVDQAALPAVVEAVFTESAQGTTSKWMNRPDYRERTIRHAVSDTNSGVASPSSSDLQLESHGDVRNARAFAHFARGRFLYVSTRDQWLRWDGMRWRLCEKDEHLAEAKRVCHEMYNAAGRVLGQDQERGRKLVTDAVASHNLPRIMAMLKLAASEPGMSVTETELDSDPYLLGVESGVIDLRTGHHLLNQPAMLITRHCNAAYSGSSKCDRWLKFLDQIFEGDADTIETVQRLLGYTLLGLSIEEILVICYGYGSNGKSVFSNVVHTILGRHAVTAPPSLLTAHQTNDNGPRNDIAAIAGARYLSVNEVQAGDRLDEQVVKMLAGREPITARFLHREFFTFRPSFTPWLRTNHKPIILGQDDGIWRRLVILRFGKTFTDEEKDPHLEQKLLEERDGILHWIIEGAIKYQQDGLRLSPRMKAEWANYRKESDLLGEFLTDKTVPRTDAKTDQVSLYGAYRTWCEHEAGVRPMSKKSFTQRLAERGYSEAKSGAKRFYRGLLLPPPESAATLDRMDRIAVFPGIPLKERSTEHKTPNEPTSCPTRPIGGL